MSTHPTHDLAIRTGEYADRHTGQTKGRWLRIGTVFRHDDGGTSIKLDAIPLGIPDWQGWVSVFPRNQPAGQGRSQPPAQGPQINGFANARQAQAPMPPQAPGAYQDFDDEIPFD
jgi:hypothetical protein